ncbi:hypothetical protein D3C72_1793410 [compost metagenome]
MIAGALQQGLDLGEAGIEVHAGERRSALGDNALQMQFGDCRADFFQWHPVHAVFQLQDVQHGCAPD